MISEVASPAAPQRSPRWVFPALLSCLLLISSIRGALPAAYAASELVVSADGTYATVNAALAAASDGDIISVQGDIVESSTIKITKDVTLKAATGGGSITSDASTAVLLENGKSLTLGGGDDAQLLKIIQRGKTASAQSTAVRVTNGEFHMRSGIEVSFANSSKTQFGIQLDPGAPNSGSQSPDVKVTGDISGGTVKTSTTDNTSTDTKIALTVSKGVKLSEVSGGEFFGQLSALEVTGGEIGVITGGTFKGSALGRHSVYFQDDAKIGKITGGRFEQLAKQTSGSTSGSAAVSVMRGATIDEISGGSFLAPKGATGRRHQGLMIHSDDYGSSQPGRVGTISGGMFSGDVGLWLSRSYNYNLTARETFQLVNAITGGKFVGNGSENLGAGIIVEAYTKVGEISGGEMSGDDGIRVVGEIGSLSGNIFADGETNGLRLWGNSGNLFEGGKRAATAKIGEIMGGFYRGGEAGIENATSGNMGNNPRGHIGRIGGDTFAQATGDWGSGLVNSGTIGTIKDGGFHGKAYGLKTEKGWGSYSGKIERISGGTFCCGKAVYLAHRVEIEPDLSGSGKPRGEVRFYSRSIDSLVAASDQNDIEASLPKGYIFHPEVKESSRFYKTSGEIFYVLTRTFQLSFDPGEGTGAMWPITKPAGATITLPPNTFIAPEGYEFSGWNTASDGSGTGYVVGDEVTVKSALTLYAQWKPVAAPSTPPSATPSASAKPTPTAMPSASAMPTPTAMPSASAMPTPTAMPSASAMPTPTAMPSASPDSIPRPRPMPPRTGSNGVSGEQVPMTQSVFAVLRRRNSSVY